MNRLSALFIFLLACSNPQDSVIATPLESPAEAPLLVSIAPSPHPVAPPPPRIVTIPESDRSLRNAILLARVAINENSRPLRSIDDGGTAGQPTADARALIQEQIAFAKWRNITLRQAILWQSKYVTGIKKAKDGSQHAWTSNLPAEGKARPRGWVECSKTVRKGCGRWAAYADNWVAFRDWVIDQVVKKGAIEAECPGNPITWGGDGDAKIAIARGLCVLECGDLNTFWAFPGQGCDEPMRDVLIRENIKVTRNTKTVPAREIMKALRDKDDPS